MLELSTSTRESNPNIANYIKNEVMALTSTEVILKIYDFAILNLKKSNPQKALHAITELIVSLNFEHKDISLGLYRLYQFCREEIIKGKYNNAIVILEGLRDTWAKAFKLEKGS